MEMLVERWIAEEAVESEPLYFDYAATTPPAPEVISAIEKALRFHWGNLSSHHHFGYEAKDKVEAAIAQIASILGVERDELIFTSGATESINQAIKGVLKGGRKRHLITSTIEHKATLQSAQALLKEGYEVTFLAPNESGLITAEMVEEAIREETGLISLIWVNNESGHCQPVEEIAAVAKEAGVPLHLDATQAAPHLPIRAREVDLMSLSAHKCYGPKGIGVLYRRNFPRLPLKPLIDGGGGQLGIRAGTMMNEQIIGFSKALSLIEEQRELIDESHTLWGEYLLERLAPLGVRRNHTPYSDEGEELLIPSILNLHCPNIHHDTLLALLPNIALATGSACNSDERLPSYILTELGYSERHAYESIRISLGRYTTYQEVEALADALEEVIKKGQHWSCRVVREWEACQKVTLEEPSFAATLYFKREGDGAIHYKGGTIFGEPGMMALFFQLERYLLTPQTEEALAALSIEDALEIKLPPYLLRPAIALERRVRERFS